MRPKARILNDPNESEEVVACRAAWRNYDNKTMPVVGISSDQIVGWEDGERVGVVPTCEIELPAHPRDLLGWNTLTILEGACVVALDYGEPRYETAARLGKSVASIKSARERARAKLLEAMEKETARRPRSGTGLQAVMK